MKKNTGKKIYRRFSFNNWERTVWRDENYREFYIDYNKRYYIDEISSEFLKSDYGFHYAR